MSNYILHVENSLLRPGELFFFYQTKEGAEKEKQNAKKRRKDFGRKHNIHK